MPRIVEKNLNEHIRQENAAYRRIQAARMEAENPFERGWRDAERGISFRDCPYLLAYAAIAWRNGYRALYASAGLPLAE